MKGEGEEGMGRGGGERRKEDEWGRKGMSDGEGEKNVQN